MIKISELKVIEDAFWNADLIYYKPSLYAYLEEHFTENFIFNKKSLMKLKQILANTDGKAHDEILKHDLKKIMDHITKVPKEFDEETWRGFLPKIRDEVKAVLGLDFKPRSVFFAARFPRGLFNFEKKGASSLTIFEGSPNSGIYFLNKRVSTFFTPIQMIHEQLHSCLSQNKSKEQMYIEWFEEGLCMWYSIIIYYKITKNSDVIDMYKQRNYIYNRVKPDFNFSRRYYEYMKIFKRLYLHGGPELIGKILFDYLSNKRDEVNKYLELDKFDIKYLPKAEIDQVLLRSTTMVEPENVTPLEYMILKSAMKPKTLQELCMLIHAPDGVVKEALMRLQFKGMIVIKNNFFEINWRKKDLFDHGLIKAVYPFR